MPMQEIDLAVARPTPTDAFEVRDCALYIIEAPATFSLWLDQGEEIEVNTTAGLREIKRRDGDPIGYVKISNAAAPGMTARLFYNSNYSLRFG